MKYSLYTKGIVLSLAAIVCVTATAQSQHYENVLGTSMDITVISGDAAARERGFAAALTEVERLEQVFSSYRDDSELSILNRDRSTTALSNDLATVISACIDWEARTDGAFSCKMGSIRKRWQQAVADQEVPNRREVRAIARQLKLIDLPRPGAGAYTLPDTVMLDVGGIAKGYIIDRVADAIADVVPGATGIKVDIGGDALYRGRNSDSAPWQVGVTSEHADGEATHGVVALSNRGIAASAHQSRARQIGRKQFSHIVATRDGWPVAKPTASYVIADSAMAADVVATMAASVLPSDAMKWIESQDAIDALLVMPSGRQLASVGWRASEIVESSPLAANMMITYEIPKQDVGKYRRPYVALWISDESRAPVRNLLLLGDSSRWAQENRKWWRAVGRDDETILDGFARSTRRPGTYTVQWDGRDDRGQMVSGTRFRLHLEAAREHGGHTYKTVDLDISNPVDERILGDGEFGTISISWQSARAVTAIELPESSNHRAMRASTSIDRTSVADSPATATPMGYAK
ncbi:MAG: DUF2271 domain-containing protein [Pseudomonadota bacterium]